MASGGKSNSAARAFLNLSVFDPSIERRWRHIDRPPPPVRRKIRIPLQVPLDRAHAHPERVRHGLLADEPVTQRNILRFSVRAGIS